MTFQFKTKPYDHQLKIFERSKDLEFHALFMEQGTGKTKVAIDTASHMFLHGKITGAVIFANKGVYGNWFYEELPAHSSVPYRAYIWKGFTKTTERESFNGILEPGHLAWFIFNIDAITSPRFGAVISSFMKAHPHFLLIGDETTTIKNPKANRTKAAIALSTKAVARRILSGLPNPQTPFDLYTQGQFLKSGVFGHNSFHSFKARYGVTKQFHFGPRSFSKVVDYQFLDELEERVKRVASIVKKEDCLDLPPKIYKTMSIDLTDEQRKAYDDLVNLAVAQIGREEIVVLNALGLITKLMQIVCGQIKVGPDKYVSIENNRLSALTELVSDSPGKVVVWTHYVQTAKDIMKALDGQGVLLPGGIDPQERQDRLQLFKTGEPKVLVANPASSGHGITLVEADTVIYYSNSYNLEHRLQSEDRTHRIGQTKSVLYIDLVAPNTIEGAVIKALKDKKNLADKVINSASLREFLEENR